MDLNSPVPVHLQEPAMKKFESSLKPIDDKKRKFIDLFETPLAFTGGKGEGKDEDDSEEDDDDDDDDEDWSSEDEEEDYDDDEEDSEEEDYDDDEKDSEEDEDDEDWAQMKRTTTMTIGAQMKTLRKRKLWYEECLKEELLFNRWLILGGKKENP